MKKLSEDNIEIIGRKEVTYELDYEKATPKKEDILKKVSEESKASSDLIKVKHIYSHYGIQKAKIIAYIYKDKETLTKFETFNKKKKKDDKGTTPTTQEQAKETPKAEAKPKETPKKEVKETPKEEKKE